MLYNRMPLNLTEIIIANQTFWAEDWLTLCNKINFVPENN